MELLPQEKITGLQLRLPDSFESGYPAGNYFGGWVGLRLRLQKTIDFIKKIDTIKTTNRKQAAEIGRFQRPGCGLGQRFFIS